MEFNTTSQQPNVYNITYNVSELDRRRLLNYRTFWRFYLGDHWITKREEGNEPITANYCKKFINKKIAFTFGKGFSVVPHDELPDEAKAIISEIWEYNEAEFWGKQSAMMGSVTGDLFIKPVWVKNEDSDDAKDGCVKNLILDSSMCFPLFKKHNKDVIEKMVIAYEYAENPDPSSGQPQHAVKNKQYVEIITPEKVIVYDDNEKKEEPNTYGFINIVHARNEDIANLSFGVSDLQDLVPLNREFNEKTTNVSDIINYHEAPVTIVYGAKASTLQKSPNKLWSGLPETARVENLRLDGDLSATVNFLTTLKTTMFELSDVPEATLGKQQAVSNTSGVALQIQYQPLTEDRDSKILVYGRAIRQVTKMAMKIYAFHKLGDITYFDKLKTTTMRDPYKTKVIFKDTLPKDKMVLLQIIQQKFGMTGMPLTTPRLALIEMGDDNPDKTLEEINKWVEEMKAKGMDASGVDNMDEQQDTAGETAPKKDTSDNTNGNPKGSNIGNSKTNESSPKKILKKVVK